MSTENDSITSVPLPPAIDPPLRVAAAEFFDEFVVAFRTFDGNEIARRYLSPYSALHADGSIDCFASNGEIAAYFQKVVDGYRGRGCRSCRYKELEVVAVGERGALATVTWELVREDGSVLSRWRESYNLARTAEGLRVFSTVDHAEAPRTPAPASREPPRPPQRYLGACHCGTVRFAIETDFPELTTCDCSICKRRNALMVKVHESRFELLAGGEALVEYQFHTRTARHFFCATCGIYPFHRKRVTPDFYGINVHCLEGFDPTGIPVRAAVGAGMP